MHPEIFLPHDPPWSLSKALLTYPPHARTSKTDTCITKQSDASERRKTALTMLYPGTQKNAARLPCTQWHTHTHTLHAWSQRECRRGERGGVRQHAKRRMSKKPLGSKFGGSATTDLKDVRHDGCVCGCWNRIGSDGACEWVKRRRKRECKNLLCIITSVFSAHGELTAKLGLM